MISAGSIAALPSVLAPSVDGNVLFGAESAGTSCSTSIRFSSTTSVAGTSDATASAVAIPSESATAAAAAAAGDSLSAGGILAGVEGDLTERSSA